MRSAIAHGRAGNLTSAIQSIDRALALRPDDPFYQDLKAELYMRNRAFSDSARAYKKAHDLRLKDAIILAGYGRALLADGKFSQALDILEQARVRDFRNSTLLRDQVLPMPNWANMPWRHLLLRNVMHCGAALRMPKCTQIAPPLDYPLIPQLAARPRRHRYSIIEHTKD